MPSIVTDLLLDEADRLPDAARWLVLGGETALPNDLARDGRGVEWRPVDIRELSGILDGVVVGNNISVGAYDRVVVPIPPDRALARRWLLTARHGMVPGGRLLLAGANADGAKSVLADAAAVFGPARSEHYRQKHRIAHFVAGSDEIELPPWVGAVGMAPGTWQQFRVDLGEETITLETQPGVFAGDRLDPGTRLLLEHLEIYPGSRVLDVGCGVGVIGIAASRRGASHVDLLDSNLLAVEAAARNLQHLGVSGRVLASDVFAAVRGERYDLIVSNPPFHRGKHIDYSVADRLISEAPAQLLPNGRLLIVANAFLAYGKHLERVFRQVEVVAATRQYHVLMGTELR